IGDYHFTVTAESTTDATVQSTADGKLTVVANGVSVALSPSSGLPGSTFQMTVTNTGTVTDTYNLAVNGPTALVASLGTTQVPLAPGAHQMIPITTGPIDFAVQGTMTLVASATSQSNPAVQNSARASLSIPASTGLTAEFSPAV